MILTGGFDGFDVIDSRFWWFWQVVLMVLMFWQQVLMALMFWQQVLMFLMILTGGFVFEGCIINDSRFWCFWWFWQQVLMIWQVVLMVLMFWQQVLMILTGGFDGFDSRFWQQVLMILTGGFCFWRLYNKSFYWQKVSSFEDAVIRKFPSHPVVRIWGCAVKNCEGISHKHLLF